MTLKSYITSKFQSLGIQLSDADLFDVYTASGLEENTEINGDNINLVNLGIISFIPAFLLKAKSISENGFSMSWYGKGIQEYYSFLCNKYGLEDKLSDKPKINFL